MGSRGRDTSSAMHDPPAWQMKQLREPIKPSKRKSKQTAHSATQSQQIVGTPRLILPIELQFRVLWHVITDLHQGDRWDRARGWRSLVPFLRVCRPWGQEIRSVVAECCEMLEVVWHGPSDPFVCDVLALWLARGDGSWTATKGLVGSIAERDFPQSLELLLNAGAKPANEEEELKLIQCALTYNSGGRYTTTKLLIERGYVKSKQVSIYRAVDIGDKALIRWLLDHGADATSDSSLSALCHACNLDRLDIVELLLERGTAVSDQDLRHFCWTTKYVGTVFKHAADAPQRGLAIAADRHKSGEFIKLCLQWGADPNEMVDGMPILSIAVRKQLPEVCEMLLNAGADPTPEVEQRNLPLYCAATGAFSPENVRVLCDFGASIPPIAPERRKVPKFNQKISYDGPVETIEGTNRQNVENSIRPSDGTKSSVKSAWRKLASRK